MIDFGLFLLRDFFFFNERENVEFIVLIISGCFSVLILLQKINPYFRKIKEFAFLIFIFGLSVSGWNWVEEEKRGK